MVTVAGGASDDATDEVGGARVGLEVGVETTLGWENEGMMEDGLAVLDDGARLHDQLTLVGTRELAHSD